MTALRRFARSTGIMALLYALSSVLGFLVGVMLARLLGASGYGVYALAMTTATLVGTLTEFGLPVLAMREVGTARSNGNWGRVRGLIAWSDRLILALSSGLIGATLLWIALRPDGDGVVPPAALLWAAALVPFVAIGKLRGFLLLALDRVFASQFPAMVLRPVLFLAGCLAIWGLSGQLAPESALAVQTVAAALVMVLAIAFYRRSRPAELVAATPQRAVRDWLSASLPMGLTEGLRLLQGQLALLLVGFLASASQAGIYRVADAIAQVTALIASVAGTAATPLFAKLWGDQDRAGLQRIAVTAAWAMTLGAMGLGLPVLLLGPWLFPALFGTEFGASVPVFALLLAGLIAAGTLGLTLALANMTGQHLLATRAFVIIAVINLLCGVLLIPAHGALGGAIGTVFGTLLGTGWCALAYYRRTGLNPTLFQAGAIRIGRDALRSGLARLGGPGQS